MHAPAAVTPAAPASVYLQALLSTCLDLLAGVKDNDWLRLHGSRRFLHEQLAPRAEGAPSPLVLEARSPSARVPLSPILSCAKPLVHSFALIIHSTKPSESRLCLQVMHPQPELERWFIQAALAFREKTPHRFLAEVRRALCSDDSLDCCFEKGLVQSMNARVADSHPLRYSCRRGVFWRRFCGL